MPQPRLVDHALRLARVDFAPAHRPPPALRVAVATVLSVGGSLLADAVAVVIAVAVFPATKGYAHFQFADYAKLTVAGVIIACVAWPIVARLTSSPRWLFFRLAILVTLGLYLPDLWLLVKGEPATAVGVLMVMHLAIALVTYNVLVHVAAVRPERQGARHRATGRSAPVS